MRCKCANQRLARGQNRTWGVDWITTNQCISSTGQTGGNLNFVGVYSQIFSMTKMALHGFTTFTRSVRVQTQTFEERRCDDQRPPLRRVVDKNSHTIEGFKHLACCKMRYSPPKSNVIIFHIKATTLGYRFWEKPTGNQRTKSEFHGVAIQQ